MLCFPQFSMESIPVFPMKKMKQNKNNQDKFCDTILFGIIFCSFNEKFLMKIKPTWLY